MTKISEIQRIIQEIEKNNLIEILEKCQSIKERYDRLIGLLPEILLWDPISTRQLVFYLQRADGLDFGVCDFYTIKGDRQYCSINNKILECLCTIPQDYCVLRDKNGKPKYPEFAPVQTVELSEEVIDALRILGNCARGAVE